MNLELRSFNAPGVQEFRKFLAEVKSGASVQEHRDVLLQHHVYTEIVDGGITVSPRQFANRLEAGEYFVNLFEGISETLLHEKGREIWSWLSLYYFDAVCPANNGVRKVGEDARYIPEPSNFWKYYRHLLYGPFSICHAHDDNPERAMAVLCSPLHQPGDAVESLASRQDMITCPAVMEVATKLYVNSQTQQYKYGSRRRDGKGGARRLARVLMQFDLTYDLLRIPTERLLDMLPSEFDEFKPEAGD